MGRWHVHVVQMRARDIRVGDVVNRDPTKFDGWFRVHEIRQLGSGTYNILDKSNAQSFTVGPFDLVGLQTPVQLPAEAERNARGAESGHGTTARPTSDPGRGNRRPQPDHPQSQTSQASGVADQPAAGPTAAARREAAAREALARGEAGGGARALPGS